jgi:hypothetical protein
MIAPAPDTPPTPDKLTQLIIDLQGKYKKPDPENLSMKAIRFEQVFNRLIIPFIGANAFLLGGIILYRLYPHQAMLLSACNFIAALLIISLVFFHNREHEQTPPLMVSVAMASVLAAVLNLPNVIITWGLPIIIAFAFAVCVYFGKFDQKAVVLYGLYFPFLIHFLGPNESYQRLIFDALVIIPTLILFIHGKMRLATFAMILSAALTAIMEIDKFGATPLWTLILIIFLILFIYYEIRIPKTGYSNLRTFLDQSIFLLLTLFLFLLVGPSPDELQSRMYAWAAFVVVYEGLQYLREKIQSHTRLALAVIAITMAIWVGLIEYDFSPPALRYLAVLVGTMWLAALLHLAALSVENLFLSNVAILLLFPVAAWISLQSYQLFCLLVILLGPLTAIELAFISRRPVFPVQLPWWSGFLREDHVEWLKNAGLTITAPILTAPFISFFANLIRSSFLWLRYFKGEEEPFGLMDILFATANIYGAFILTNQLAIVWTVYQTGDSNRAFIAILVWALWGLGIFLVGIYQSCVYYRLLGTSVIIIPWIAYRKGIIYRDQEALMALITGAALLLVGLLLITISSDGPNGPGDEIAEKIDQLNQ